MDSTKKSNEIEERNKAVEFLNNKFGEETSQEFKERKHTSAFDAKRNKHGIE